MDGRAYEW